MATDIFAKIGAILGDRPDVKHKNEIDVLSWAWGVTQRGRWPTGWGAGGGQGELQRLHLHPSRRQGDAASEACATGTHIADTTITVRKAGKGQQEYLIIEMSDVLIRALHERRSRRAPSAEDVALQFAKVDLEYRPQKADGSLDRASTSSTTSRPTRWLDQDLAGSPSRRHVRGGPQNAS